MRTENSQLPKGCLSLADFLTRTPDGWFRTRKRDYLIQGKTVSEDTPVYNTLEDARYVARAGADVVLKGSLGEEWVTSPEKVARTYTRPDGSPLRPADFAPQDCWIPLRTAPAVDCYACRIPPEYRVAVPTLRGSLLLANREGIPHGDGDHLVCAAGPDGGPDLSDVWVVNGLQFAANYTSNSV